MSSAQAAAEKQKKQKKWWFQTTYWIGMQKVVYDNHKRFISIAHAMDDAKSHAGMFTTMNEVDQFDTSYFKD